MRQSPQTLQPLLVALIQVLLETSSLISESWILDIQHAIVCCKGRSLLYYLNTPFGIFSLLSIRSISRYVICSTKQSYSTSCFKYISAESILKVQYVHHIQVLVSNINASLLTGNASPPFLLVIFRNLMNMICISLDRSRFQQVHDQMLTFSNGRRLW